MWGWNLGNVARNRQRLPLWQSALEQCGVGGVESSGIRQVQLTGRAGPIEVRITDAPGQENGIVVALAGPESFSVLKLRRQSLEVWAREIEVGDEGFDEMFIVEGEIRPVCALLDVWLRRELIQASAACGSLEIHDGELRFEIAEEDLARLLPLLLGIGRKLAEPLDVERRIARNAHRDPKPGVRLRNLLLLARERPGAPDILAAFRAACSDASPEIRLRAAIELGEDGGDTLLKIAESTEDDALRIQAISHLGSHFGASAVELLARLLAEERAELAIAAAQALGATGEAAAEPPLLQALQSEDSPLRIAAATALGRTGSAAAVQPLQDAAGDRWLDRALRRAANQAVAEIQSRLTSAAPGQLSLAETEAGQLSLAHDAGGELSLAADPAGQLALPPDEPEADAQETVCGG